MVGTASQSSTPHQLRHHQRLALEAIEKAWDAGRKRACVVLPPGAGKTLVGLETARRRGVPAVVLGPNTAIQGQWLRGWDAFDDEPESDSREVRVPLTALTYQSLATFDEDGPRDAGHDEPATLLATLHPHGRALVHRLKQIGDLTLVLDECHHLLEVWGRLVCELLDELPHAFVLGLTATPPDTLTRSQAALVDDLFGEPVYEVSVPAAVRQGDLAPFAELAWLTSPTARERDWLAEQGQRFAELTTALTDPAYGSTTFLHWLDRRFVQRDMAWRTLAAAEPEVTDAALRMVHHGLLRRPPQARLVERHRHAPTTDDWVLLIDGWVRHLRTTGRDDAVVEAIRRALPSVGYQLTSHGIRRGWSPVDRVLARSEAKTLALTQIVEAEHRVLGDRLRQLVLCDHERATATLPADLEGVLDVQSGSATLALGHLLRALPQLGPLLVTGTTVAGSRETLHRLRQHAGRPDLTIVDGRLEGSWTSRDWVPAVTRFFEAGHCQVLVGTRGLLGEGWDARAVTGLVDLTTATTSTAVVQTRGRALRVDPSWPEKVGVTWSVVCVSDEHPDGARDWERFVRKHDGFFGVDRDGEVVAGVAHVDAGFSPYAPPATATFDSVNGSMLARCEERAAVRDAWAVGSPFDDVAVATVRVTDPVRRPRRPDAAAVVLRDRSVEVRDARPSPWRPHPLLAVGLVLAVAAFLLNVTPSTVVAIALAAMAGLQATVAVDRGRRLAEELTVPPSVDQVARAVADALQATGLSPRGADAVRVELDDHGSHRCVLQGVDAPVSATFATALDEAVSPMASPRYVVPRRVLTGPADNGHGARAALGLLRSDAEVWHSVPTMLGTTGRRAREFAGAWDRWVGGGEAVYTGSPEGEGVLVTHRGSDPFAVTTVLRSSWR